MLSRTASFLVHPLSPSWISKLIFTWLKQPHPPESQDIASYPGRSNGLGTRLAKTLMLTIAVQRAHEKGIRKQSKDDQHEGHNSQASSAFWCTGDSAVTAWCSSDNATQLLYSGPGLQMRTSSSFSWQLLCTTVGCRGTWFVCIHRQSNMQWLWRITLGCK